MTPRLSIVIVNWNAAARLRRCLDALRTQAPEEVEARDGVEVVIVDNGSTDDSLATARAAWPEAVLVSLPENLGFAEGCNRGIAVSRGAWVLTLNNDTEVRPGFLAAVQAGIDDAPADVGMMQPPIHLAGRGRLNSTGVVVHRDGSAHDRDFGAPVPDDGPAAEEVFCVTAGAGVYRRAMLDAIRGGGGWFDPTYFMYFEDVDLGWRARLAGWRAMVLPAPAVDHAFQGTSRRHGRHFVTIQCMRNRVRTLLKNASWRMVLRSLPRSASDLLWLLQHAGGRALAEWVLAVRDGLVGRRFVSGLATEDRTAVERRWVEARP